jgi:hypothetical protein
MIETIEFPVPYPTLVSCPFCIKGCLACDGGVVEINKREAWAQIQRPHVIKFLADNIDTVSRELTTLFKISPSIETIKNVNSSGKWSIVEIRTTQGSTWIAIPIEKRKPIYFESKEEMDRWLV